MATGKAEVALHEIQELMAVPGIEIVGPLPPDLQETFALSAAIMVGAKDMNAAKALVEFLLTPEARAVIKAKGMDAIIQCLGLPKRRGLSGCNPSAAAQRRSQFEATDAAAAGEPQT